MNHAFAIQHCRIVAPEKLPDRFLASGFLQQADGATSDQQVCLAYILEIAKPWFPSSKVLPTLISALEEQLPGLAPNNKLEDRFELVLRQLNDHLNTLSEQGETDWIGNLNGLILVLSGDQLHFSQTGHCPAYILQKNRIRQITDDLPDEHDPHPLKTFSNLASGRLQEQDQILLANQELYEEVSLDALRRVMNSHTPAQASTSITKELAREKNRSVTSLIIRLTSRGELENQKTPEPTEIILEEAMQGQLKKLRKKLRPVGQLLGEHAKRVGEGGLQVANKTREIVSRTVLPATSSLIKKGVAEVKKHQPKKNEADEPGVFSRPSAPVVERVFPQAERDKQAMQQLARQAEEKIETNYTPLAELPEEPEIESEAIPPSPTIPTWQQLKKSARHWFSSRKRTRYTILAVAAILLSISIWTALARQHPSGTGSTVNENSNLLSDATAQQKKAATALKLRQEVEAGREVTQGLNDLNLLANLSPDQKKSADTLWQSFTEQADALTSTTRLSPPSATYSFPSSSQSVVSRLPYFYGLNPAGNAVLRAGQGDPGLTEASIALPESDDHPISMAASSESDTSAYLLTKKDKVYRVVQNGSVTSLSAIQPVSGTFASGEVIGSYIGNVYILDGKSGLLWRYQNTGTAYNAGVSIIDSSKYDIKGSISLAIDGSIYILKGDGTLLQFTSGKQQSFALKDQPALAKSFVQPLQVVTNENMDDIYILDGGLSSGLHSTAKIYRFDKSGHYLGAYGLPENYTGVSAFDIDPTAKKLWVVNAGQIGEFNI